MINGINIQIDDGYLKLRQDLGGGEITTSILTVKVNDGIYHTVTITRYGSNTAILLDHMYISMLSTNLTNDPLTSVYFGITKIFLGGLIDTAGSFNNSFIGCIYGMTLDNYNLPVNEDSDVFTSRTSNNQPILPCNSTIEATPPSIVSVLTTLYVMFGLTLVCLFIISVTFVSCCKVSHYMFTRNKDELPISERRPSRRFIDFPNNSTIPSSPNIIARNGLQSTASFEPIQLSKVDIDTTRDIELQHVSNSPSITSDSVFETAVPNDYQPYNIPSPTDISTPPEIISPSRVRLDPMTGMPIHKSDSPDGAKDDVEVKSYISKRLEHANYLLESINSDSVKIYAEEGLIELWDKTELQILHSSLLEDIKEEEEEEEVKLTKLELCLTSPTSPVVPSPLLQSRKWESPPKAQQNENSFKFPQKQAKPTTDKLALSSIDNLHVDSPVKPQILKKPPVAKKPQKYKYKDIPKNVIETSAV